MTEQASKWTTALEIVLLASAALLYVFGLLSISTLGGSDPAGNALEAAFVTVVFFLLWLPLIALVALCCRRPRRSGKVLAIGMVMCLVGAVTSVWSIEFLRNASWVRIAPTILPPLALLFGVWARFGADGSPQRRAWALGGFTAMTAAAAAPVPIEAHRWQAAAPEREAEWRRQEAERARQEAEAAAQRARELRALGPDSRLEQVLVFRATELEEEAIAKIRTLRSASADAVRLLDGGTELFEFRRLPDFGIPVTPALCASYRRRIESTIVERDPAHPDLLLNAAELVTYIDNFRWFHGNGCNMSDLAARTAALLRRHPNELLQADGAMFEEIR